MANQPPLPPIPIKNVTDLSPDIFTLLTSKIPPYFPSSELTQGHKMGIASLKGKAIIIDCHALPSALCFPCTLLEMGSWQAKWNGSPGEIQP